MNERVNNLDGSNKMNNKDERADITLYNNFMLNEIKSIDDSIRTTQSLLVILTGAYFTIVATNFNEISNVMTRNSFFKPIEVLGVIIIPPFIFFTGLFICYMSDPPIKNINLLNPKSATVYLFDLASYKFAFLRNAELLIIFTFLYIAFIFLSWLVQIKYMMIFIVIIGFIVPTLTGIFAMKKNAKEHSAIKPVDEEIKKKG